MIAMVSLIMAGVLIFLLLFGTPICVAIAISSVAAGAYALDLNMILQTGAQRTFSGISIFSLIAIPFFILAGNIMNQGGIAIRLMNLAHLLVGKLPASYAQSNAMANMLFGAISGSGAAAASAMGTIIGPVALKDGYDRDFITTVNVVTAPTGLLIPPSNVLITYSLISGGTSVAALFIGGFIPGIMWGVGCMLVAGIIGLKKGYKNSSKGITLAMAGKILFDALPSLLLIVIVIGGIIVGAFTATEGAVVAVVYSLILGVFYHSMDLKKLWQIYLESAEMTGIIIILVGISSIMSWVVAFVNIPAAVGDLLIGISDNPIVILIIINLFLLFIGTFMDATPAVLIFTPIFLPICLQIGLSPLEFGIIIVFNLCVGLITPPVGTILFVGVKVGKTTIERVMRCILPYYFVIFIVLMLIIYIPFLSSYLPYMAGYTESLGPTSKAMLGIQ